MLLALVLSHRYNLPSQKQICTASRDQQYRSERDDVVPELIPPHGNVREEFGRIFIVTVCLTLFITVQNRSIKSVNGTDIAARKR